MSAELLILATVSAAFYVTDYRERKRYQRFQETLHQTYAKCLEILELDQRQREKEIADQELLKCRSIGIDEILRLETTASIPGKQDNYAEHMKLVTTMGCPCGGHIFLINPIEQQVFLGTSSPNEIACHWTCCAQCGRVTLYDSAITARLMKQVPEGTSV